jgi:transcriptional regulator with XRE-family HTH domain
VDRLTADVLRDSLRRAWKRSGLTQPQIAARAGVSENTVIRVLGGKDVRTYSLIAVATVLEARIEVKEP